ncbi:Nuclear pore complex protein NUP58 [Rhynchospora pubera]|uniref:Nuclear pore complex protein NUP58 n=1 Tax=Rhynchospora pubera TaxID=906938 RepID=A0AAV8HCG8_9POAL|nr:Nuclear pore complex protein NUP58 [Rhynchospora pubera]
MALFTPQPQQTPSLQIQTPQFQFQPPQQQQQQQFSQMQMQMQLQVPQPQILLYTKEKAPAGWSTKFEDLHQDSQKFLLQIEERLRGYRDESEKLDQCTRLYDMSVSDDSFEVDAARIVQEIASTNTAIEREKASVQELVTSIKNMIRSTELAVHTYMMLRPRFVRPATAPAQNNSASATQPTNQIVPAAPPMPVFDFYSGVPKRPSAFMQHTVERLQKFLEECVRWIEELEQLVQIDANRRCSDSLEALPKVMSNVHDYFVYVASKVENLHQYMESVKTAYLIEQRQCGDDADPFLEANRREAARLEAAARRVHPTLHLPATQNTPHQLNTPNPTPAVQQPSLQPTPGFSTPAPASSGGGLFSTPSGSAPSAPLFGALTSFTPQTTPFVSASGSLFGSTPAPSGFGSTTPAIGGGTTLFSTPTFGGATASGASFGGASKSSRPKSRTSRR